MQCPACRSQISDLATRCPNCTSRLTTTTDTTLEGRVRGAIQGVAVGAAFGLLIYLLVIICTSLKDGGIAQIMPFVFIVGPVTSFFAWVGWRSGDHYASAD